MNRRIFAVLLAVALLWGTAPVALADAIMGNDFKWQHRDELQKLNRSRFRANGPEGFVIPQNEPGEAKETYTFWDGTKEMPLPKFNNGAEIIVDSLYIHNEEYWGGMTESHYVSYPGWIPMEHLLVVYIRDDFNAENKDKFYNYTGTLEKVVTSKRLVL